MTGDWTPPSQTIYDLAGATETLLRVAEVQPPGYHGHGPLAGRPVHLLRLGICNLACEWCEAPQTVAAFGSVLDQTAPYTTLPALLDRLAPQLDADPEVPLLITGGEPLLSDHAILALLQHLAERATVPSVWVETNGTIAPPDWWDDYPVLTVVSPKLGTRDPQHRRLPAGPLTAWAERAMRDRTLPSNPAFFDYACATRSDVLLAVQVCTWLGLSPAECGITPRGRGHDEQCASLAAVLDTALEHGFGIDVMPRRLLTNPIEVHRR